jgi:antitoxin (DNA-binding transcriptional repressor) of toxin-antitoxin stability system
MWFIAKVGKPVVKVTALSSPTGAEVRRLGFMAVQTSVPDDFDQMGREEIERILGKAVAPYDLRLRAR